MGYLTRIKKFIFLSSLMLEKKKIFMCHYKRQDYILNKIHWLECSFLYMNVSPSFVYGELTEQLN